MKDLSSILRMVIITNMSSYKLLKIGTFLAKRFNVMMKISLSIILFVLYIGFVAVYTYIAYVNDQNSSYVSFDPNSGTCIQKPFEVTNIFSLDMSGLWDSSKNFIPSKSIMTYHFERFSHTTDEYTDFILQTKDVIVNVTKSFKNRTLAYNLAYLMSWQYNVDDGNYAHKIKFNGDPAFVFDRLLFLIIIIIILVVYIKCIIIF